MEFNNKKLARTSKFINYTISTLLALFLIFLSSKIMDDVDEWEEMDSQQSFENPSIIHASQVIIDSLEAQIDLRQNKAEGIRQTVEIAQNNYQNEKQSYENWLAARKTIGSPKEDRAILNKAKRLDAYYKIAQDWQIELTDIENGINVLNDQKEIQFRNISNEQRAASDAWDVAYKAYNLKIFVIRLLIVLPILLLAIFFVVKFRSHKYWPLFLGFVFFALYAFFLGLVPYLPSYGGYVKYTVGIILSIVAGIYSINKVRAFMEMKKNELQESTKDRAKKVKSEVAEKALDQHMCPSCGKDFVVKKWGSDAKDKINTALNIQVTNFCRFCGLELFKTCGKCGTENYAHLPYCAGCGDEVMVD